MVLGRIASKTALIVCAYLLICIVAGIAIAEFALHPVRRAFNSASRDEGASHASDDDATLSEISITAKDGIALDAWLFRPEQWNGNSVIVLHGLKDNRVGMLDYADMLLLHGYSVLIPDARAHGESGGTVASYGFLETDDIRRWLDWRVGLRILLELQRNDRADGNDRYGQPDFLFTVHKSAALAERTPRVCHLLVSDRWRNELENLYAGLHGAPQSGWHNCASPQSLAPKHLFKAVRPISRFASSGRSRP